MVTQRESVGGIQDRMAEVMDLGVNFGCDGAKGGSKVMNSSYLKTAYSCKQVFFVYKAEICKMLVFFSFVHYKT